MKLRMILLAAMASLTFSVANASIEKVVYGEDDRLDIFETDNNLYTELARSTAAMVSRNKATRSGEVYKLSGRRLRERGICASAKFAEQVTIASCSGFLVAPNLLVTAGHCVRSARDCTSNVWVFDYGIDSEGKKLFEVPASSVYKCKRIIKQRLDRGTKDDYALIELERTVDDRNPLDYRKEGTVEKGTELVVIGHPTGLPTKIAGGAWVRSNKNPVYFQSNLDTFGGNSGSAVFDAETGTVEGILVRGETDYVYDSSRGCRVPKQCSNEGCRGEDVTRITNIKALIEEYSR